MVKGTQDYYSIQWAERGPAQAIRVVFDEQHWLARLKELMPVVLCDRVTGEKAPYPSCVSRLPGDKRPVDAVGENATQPAEAPTR